MLRGGGNNIGTDRSRDIGRLPVGRRRRALARSPRRRGARVRLHERSATDRCAIPGRTKARRTKASSPFAADGQVGPTAGISRPPSSAPSYPRCQDCSRSTMPTRHPAARTGTGARPCPRAEWRVGAADDERRALGRGAARRAHGVHAQVLSIATISSRRLPPSRILRLRRVPLARPRARAGFRRTKFPSSPLARRIRSGRMPR